MERKVTDAMGYSLTFRIENGHMLITQDQVKGRPQIKLTRNDSALLGAFIDRAIKIGPDGHPNEELPESNAILIFSESPQQMVRIVQGDQHIDLISTSWIPAACELALMIPRMGKIDRVGTIH